MASVQAAAPSGYVYRSAERRQCRWIPASKQIWWIRVIAVANYRLNPPIHPPYSLSNSPINKSLSCLIFSDRHCVIFAQFLVTFCLCLRLCAVCAAYIVPGYLSQVRYIIPANVAYRPQYGTLTC